MKGHYVIAIYRKSKAPNRPLPVLYFDGQDNVHAHEEAVRFVDMDSSEKVIKLIKNVGVFKESLLAAEQKELH